MTGFGPSGNSISFYEQGYKSSVDAPKWLKEMGLDAYEYSCTKGVKIKEGTASKIGDEAVKNNIALSIHAPYYINLASPDEKKRKNSIRYIMNSLQAARWMGAKRVVFHPGSCGKMDRGEALELVKETLSRVIEEADNKGYGDIILCPETLGKSNQLGRLEEVIEMCKLDDRLIPTVDFGHIHAYTCGGLKSRDDYSKVLETIEQQLDTKRLKNLHMHYSRVEYTSKGERKHWTLDDTEYGPEFEPLADLLIEKEIDGILICESRGIMAEDALKLKEIYCNIRYNH